MDAEAFESAAEIKPFNAGMRYILTMILGLYTTQRVTREVLISKMSHECKQTFNYIQKNGQNFYSDVKSLIHYGLIEEQEWSGHYAHSGRRPKHFYLTEQGKANCVVHATSKILYRYTASHNLNISLDQIICSCTQILTLHEITTKGCSPTQLNRKLITLYPGTPNSSKKAIGILIKVSPYPVTHIQSIDDKEGKNWMVLACVGTDSNQNQINHAMPIYKIYDGFVECENSWGGQIPNQFNPMRIPFGGIVELFHIEFELMVVPS